MVNMRVKNLGYKFVGMDREEVIQTLQNGNKTENSQQPSSTVDSDIIFKKIKYYIFSSV